MQKKRILVTGGHGFIASYVMEQLQGKGYQVVTNVRSIQPDVLPINIETYQCDIRDSSGMLGIIQHVDGVIHLAGMLGTTENMDSLQELVDVNVKGGINIIKHCANHGVPLVLIGVGNYWMDNPYSITKTDVERFGRMVVKNDIKEGGKKVWVNTVRAMNAIGPRQKGYAIKKIMPTFINAALSGEALKVYGGKDKCSFMDLVYAGDVAKALIDVLERTMRREVRGETFTVGSGIAPSVYEIAKQIIELSGSESTIEEVPMRPGEDEGSTVVAENPYPVPGGYADLAEVIRSTIAYYRDLRE